jgi:hypothetical protein
MSIEANIAASCVAWMCATQMSVGAQVKKSDFEKILAPILVRVSPRAVSAPPHPLCPVL